MPETTLPSRAGRVGTTATAGAAGAFGGQFVAPMLMEQGVGEATATFWSGVIMLVAAGLAPLARDLIAWLRSTLPPAASLVVVALATAPLLAGCVSYDAGGYLAQAEDWTSAPPTPITEEECIAHGLARDALQDGPDRAYKGPVLGKGQEIRRQEERHEAQRLRCVEALRRDLSPGIEERIGEAFRSTWRAGRAIVED